MKFRDAIIFSGGATLGSVTPLLALAETLAHEYPHVARVWMGTWRGVERGLVSTHMTYFALCNGKFRRYISFHTIIDPWLFLIGFFQSLILMIMMRPRAVVSAGGFVAVPLHWAAFLLRIPSLSVQLDVPAGLANRLVRPVTTRVVSTMVSMKDAPPRGSAAIPVRRSIREVVPHHAVLRAEAQRSFSLRPDKPTVLVMGGGIGAVSLNQAVRRAAPSLVVVGNIIHLTGKRDPDTFSSPGYYAHVFLDEAMPRAYAAADVVICRAGMGTLAECAYLALPCIVVPLPGSAQEKNAEYLDARNAVMVIPQNDEMPARVLTACTQLLLLQEKREALGRNLAKVILTDDGASLLRVLHDMQVICPPKFCGSKNKQKYGNDFSTNL